MRYSPIGTGLHRSLVARPVRHRAPDDVRLAVPLGDVVPVPASGSWRSVPASRTGDDPRSSSARSRFCRGTDLLRVGAAARHPRQGAGVEPAAAAVLVPHAVPARGARRRRDRAVGRAVRRVGRARPRCARRRRAVEVPALDVPARADPALEARWSKDHVRPRSRGPRARATRQHGSSPSGSCSPRSPRSRSSGSTRPRAT